MRRGLVTGTTVGGAAALLLASAIALGQDPSPASEGAAAHSYQATLRAGSCADLGDVTALLADVAPVVAEDPGGWLGPTPGQPVRVSVSEIPMTLTGLADDGNAIVVGDLDQTMPVACGDVGGQLISETSVAVALLPVGESQVSGIALLDPLGIEATSVRLFILVGGDRVTAPTETPTPDPSASPAGAGDDIEPDPDDIGPDPESDIDPGEDIDVDVGEEPAS